MKKITQFLAVLLISFLFQVNAQDIKQLTKKTPAERSQLQTQWMKDKLLLGESQVDLVYAINLKYANMNDPLLKSTESKVSKFKKLKASQKEKENELKKIFTPDQFSKYLIMKDELKNKMKTQYK